MSPQPASRPGGRSSRVLGAIYTAVGELVGEGADRVTFPVVAERAGVNPTTLYRRWDDVQALLEEVTVAALTRDGDSVPDTGSLATDLSEWATVIVRDITRPERTRYLRSMASSRLDLVAHCPVTERRLEQAAEIVDHAVARGESTPSAQQVLDHVIAPMYYRVIVALAVDEPYALRMVADVLSMVRVPAPAPPPAPADR